LSEVITGCIHIHTTFSDGNKSFEEVAHIADDVGLDFIMVSDHMTLQPLQEGKEGYYGNTLAIIGYEIHDPNNKNHYLVFGLNNILNPRLPASEYVPQAAEKGAVGIIAHPDEIRNYIHKYPSYPWTEWGVGGFNGIEIWNHMSEWMERLRRFNKLKMFIFPRRSLQSPTKRILRKWDELNMKGKIAGVGSVDVHAFPYKLGPLRLVVFPYKVQFKSIRTHLIIERELSKDIKTAKGQILGAIRDCRVFISNYRWGDASRFNAEILTKDGVVQIGGEKTFEEGYRMQVKIPKDSQAAIIRNGKVYARFNGKKAEIPISAPGLYRVEVKRSGKGWIYTNHFKII